MEGCTIMLAGKTFSLQRIISQFLDKNASTHTDPLP